MKHRATARKRFVIAESVSAIPPGGTPLESQGRELGTLTSGGGTHALALVRLDRLAEAQDLAELYPQLGNALKQRFAGWSVFLFSADLSLPKLLRLKEARKTPFFNGALECRLFRFDMVAGYNRREEAKPKQGS